MAARSRTGSPLLCLDRVVAFDLSIAGRGRSTLAWRDRHGPLYEFTACAVDGRERAPPPPASRSAASPGSRRSSAPTRCSSPGTARSSTRRRSRRSRRCAPRPTRGARMVSICTGAFALAHAGLLDGRRATTHWFARRRAGASCSRRSRSTPTRSTSTTGRVLTSAGLSAGIDLCLHLVRADHGERIGARVARAMVAAPHRDGGQAQFIERALPEPTGTPARSSRVRRWALDHLAEPLDVADPRRAAPRSARGPSPAASSPRPGPRRSSGCTPSACSRPAGCSSTPTSPVEQVAAAVGLRLGALAARALPPRDARPRRPRYRRAFEAFRPARLTRRSASAVDSTASTLPAAGR